MTFDYVLILALSFIPMLVYTAVLWWLDRYEKEPLGLLIAAFLWGAIPSVFTALILQVMLDVPLTALSNSQLAYELLGGSIVAPLTEECIKAAALLGLLLFVRREIDSPLDGLIYGGVIGFGFAAVENAFYFISAYSETGMAETLSLAAMRAGVFGLNHAMYTGFTGLGVALALELRQKWLRPLPIVIGLSAAIVVHALHNAFATLTEMTGTGMIVLAVITDWAGVLLLLGIAVGAFFLERQRIAAYAQHLVGRGELPVGQVAVLTSVIRRRRARLAALFSGSPRNWRLTRQYQHKMTEAAFAWHRAGNGDTKSAARLQQLAQDAARIQALI